MSSREKVAPDDNSNPLLDCRASIVFGFKIVEVIFRVMTIKVTWKPGRESDDCLFRLLVVLNVRRCIVILYVELLTLKNMKLGRV